MNQAVAFIGRVIYGARNGFAHIASALKKTGKSFKLVLVESDPLPVARELEEKGYKPVILYGLSTPVFLEFALEVARAASRYPVVAGGPHAEGAYWQLLRLGVEAAVVGDGEAAMEGLALYYQGEADISDVPNIAHMSNGRPRVNRQVLVDLDDYEPYSVEHGLFPPIEIMRGCTHRCKFCQVPWLFKSNVRFRSPGNVVEAARVYVANSKRHVRFIAPVGFAYMSSDLRTPNVEAIESLLRGVREAGGIPYLGSFPSETRPETVTDEVLKIVARYAGNRKVSVGLQSASDRLLESVNRGHSVEDAMRAVDRILAHGLTPVVDIIMGMPGETREDVEATVKAMFDLASKGARLRLHYFLPLPGTPLARSRPEPLSPLYRKAVTRLLGRGVLEGDWVDQEKLAWDMYCLMKWDPAPSPEPAGYTLEGRGECSESDVWAIMMEAYRLSKASEKT